MVVAYRGNVYRNVSENGNLFIDTDERSSYVFCIALNLTDFYNRPRISPISTADGFYSFDGTTDDFYGKRNATIIGSQVSYVTGYVAYGTAIRFEQQPKVHLLIQWNINFTADSNLTVEAFFRSRSSQQDAVLIRFGNYLKMSIIDDMLSVCLATDVYTTKTRMERDRWYHLAFIYNGTDKCIHLYVNGYVSWWKYDISLENVQQQSNESIIIGEGFNGDIDQLAINLKAKRPVDMMWDATIHYFNPFEGLWQYERGPHGINVSSSNVLPGVGWRDNSINFNVSNSYVKIENIGFLGYPNQNFTVAFFIRSEDVPGIFLTIANKKTCLLQLGFEPGTNRLLTFFPNSTKTSGSILMKDPIMPNRNWVHVAITWSSENRAIVYTSGWEQIKSPLVARLPNTFGGEYSDPMTMTLGTYNGDASCYKMGEANLTQPFVGSIDELFLFSRELNREEINIVLEKDK